MSKNLRFKAAIIIVIIGACALFGLFPIVAPALGMTSPRWLSDRQLKLGLDLRGGVHLVLGVRVPPGTPPPEREEMIEQAVRTIERRVNDLGVAEPVIARQGSQGDQILVQLPGVTDVERAKAVIQSTGLLELRIVEDGPSESPDVLTSRGSAPHNVEVLTADGPTAGTTVFYLVQRAKAVAGRDLRTARRSVDENNRPAVNFTLNQDGGRRFGEVTAANVGRSLAVVLDGRIRSVANILTKITTEGRIAGNFTQAEVQNLEVVLRSGSLSAPLDYLAEQKIGPSLGADAVRSGVTASVIGLLLVVTFMLAYYRWAGVNAVAALLCNLIIVLGVMAYLGAVMTLPGIAGFVLTMGIGVDSNVLIFERIKEEVAAGHSASHAVSAGFNRVFMTLLDTHVAALIAAAFLFQFGTGAVRGFAVTLSVGLASNLFTSTFVSRTLFEIGSRRRSKQTLSI